jgi:hypothetical protein
VRGFAYGAVFEDAFGGGEVKALDWYAEWRAAFDRDTFEYGGMGIELFPADEVPRRQVGFAVAGDGESLVGVEPGDWRPEWLVIGYDTGCGDPIFIAENRPFPVYTAMHGEGLWEPKLVAPSIGIFGQCLGEFQRFAVGRVIPDEVDANPPTVEQQAQFLRCIMGLTNGDPEALGFWAGQIDVDLDAFVWP